MTIAIPVAERLWAKVEKTDQCWVWLGSVRSWGYGQINVGQNRTVHAHRLAYELCVGPIPEGLCVLHKCDVPRCVRPDHLFLGTRVDNQKDMARKGRARNGSATKLTSCQVTSLRNLYAEGVCSRLDLARRFEISKAHVDRILRGENWNDPRRFRTDKGGELLCRFPVKVAEKK